MTFIILYLLTCFIATISLLVINQFVDMPHWYMNNILLARCAYIGGIGGILYCIRGIYINRCVLNNWDTNWTVWYYLRPVASFIVGFISYIFIKAGLIALQASKVTEINNFAYLAIAFVAGYNVDNFLKKIEEVAKATLGVEKSRSSRKECVSQDTQGE